MHVLMLRNTMKDLPGRDERLSSRLQSIANELVETVEEYATFLERNKIGNTNDPQTAIDSMRVALRTAIDVYASLDTFSTTLATTMDRLSRNIQQFKSDMVQSAERWSIPRLPDEILRDILIHAATGPMVARSLSRVCKRFHSLVFGTSAIWAKFQLRTSLSPATNRAIVEWSGQHCLSVFMSADDPYSRIVETFKIVSDVRTRLNRMDIVNFETELLDTFGDHITGAELPALRFLHVHNGSHIRSVPLHEYVRMPALCHLITDFPLHPSLARNLTVFTMLIARRCRLRDYLNFLASGTQLQHLLVYYKHPFPDAEVDSLPSIELPNLESARFHFMNEDVFAEGSYSILSLLGHISPLCASRISFHGDEVRKVVAISTFLRNHKPLKDLEISLKRLKFIEPIQFLNVNHLDVETFRIRDAIIEHCTDPFRWEKLRLLCFTNCKGLRKSVLRCLTQGIKQEHRQDIHVQFHKCEGVLDGKFVLDDLENAAF